MSKRLVIEVDGGYHFIGDQQLSDQERTEYLNLHGFEVLRFTNDEVIGNTEQIIKKIQLVMDKQPTIKTSNSAPATPLPRRGRGRLLIFSAPSGSGKSTIVQWLMQEHPELNLSFSISCTSRAPRGTEQNGVEYFFISPDEFREKIANDEFIEYEEVYENRFYGTLKSQVEKQLEAGQNVIFDVDVKGGINIKKFYGEDALSVFIQPPSIEELRKRLIGRGTDTIEAIETRLAKASYELTFANQFDKIIVNDKLELAKQNTLQILEKFLNG